MTQNSRQNSPLHATEQALSGAQRLAKGVGSYGKAKKTNPEARMQIDIHDYLKVALPPSVLFSASLAGAHLHVRTATRAKAMGVKRGFPDLCFVLPNGIAHWIELKTATGSLSPEQQRFRQQTEPHGVWALCRSPQEVAAQLRAWGVPLRKHPFYPELNDD